MTFFNENIISSIEQKVNLVFEKISWYKSGCYSDIYLLSDTTDKYYILKKFKYEKFAIEEIKSYELLKTIDGLSIPGIMDWDDDLNYILMDYIEGTRLSDIHFSRKIIGQEVIKQIVMMQKKTILSDDPRLYWKSVFINRQHQILENMRGLINKGELSYDIYKIYEASIEKINLVLGNSIKKICVFHGDLTPWNIIWDDKNDKISAIIDPYKVGYGDPEYDLMMLKKANGEILNLFEEYKWQYGISEEYYNKEIYYNAWNEMCHYYYSNRKKEMNIEKIAKDLRNL